MHLLKHVILLWVFLTTLFGVVALYAFDEANLADKVWIIGAIPIFIWVVWDIIKSLHYKKIGVDVIAALAIAGAFLLTEYLAAAVITLMYASGQSLEQYAANRAKQELTKLLSRVPTMADCYVDGTIKSVPVAELQPGDRLMIKTGAVLPVDGYVSGGPAILDESSLTGESLPVTHAEGQAASSGTLNMGQPFDLITVHDAANSAYAGIIRLVQEAQKGKAPFTRMADRYALWFIPLTLMVAGGAWLFSGDPVRALAVLVVATPCPLILAAPIAMVAGISTAARQGLLIKNGAALEALANSERIILDKTGTLTTGNPRLLDIKSDGRLTYEDILQLAASLEQASFHVVSNAIVESAKQRNIALLIPKQVKDVAGKGVQGMLNNQQIMIGQPSWVLDSMQTPTSDWVVSLLKRSSHNGQMLLLLSVDHQVRGALILQDEIRTDAPRALRSLRASGVQSLSMASGDQVEIAKSIGHVLGMDHVYAGLHPGDKVKIIRQERQQGTTMMVGDGVNDAPALATADIGVAMGAEGAGASSEAADAVLMVERIDVLADGVQIARRSQAIAKQSVVVGMTLSLIAMLFAAFGYLTPLVGALLQEGIDVLVIINALRALRFPVTHDSILNVEQQEKLQKQHADLQPTLDQMRQLADRLASHQQVTAEEIAELARLIEQKLIPHEQIDERKLHPELAHKMVGNDPMAMLSRTHGEILQLCNQYLSLVNQPRDEHQRNAMIGVLYGLEAILKLHFAQEDELYSLLANNYQA
ncbi:putative copper-exporting P-type ATPase V [Hydrogenovibrio crunogenus]|uniref:P-type Zn(2+) transporter n=1 Tax=Hydrogenovibrio crunogenus TaxID=39765 RepID=A0A4P7NY43_9GAMM|nr:heavy metal translocating P-type ATPase [Hydrogenovibrio crunogenus]QBZ82683.1 putative copper-exporting P-type ATPase V [Hydrogenovibrio crunogenus]